MVIQPSQLWLCAMKFDVDTVRLLHRLTDRMNLIRNHPLRYEIDPAALQQLQATAVQLEQVLTKIKTVPVG
jgi:hypothetical protein